MEVCIGIFLFVAGQITKINGRYRLRKVAVFVTFGGLSIFGGEMKYLFIKNSYYCKKYVDIILFVRKKYKLSKI